MWENFINFLKITGIFAVEEYFSSIFRAQIIIDLLFRLK